MSLSKLKIECMQKSLTLMLRNLECPICLELIKEPVTTSCAHRFCRFCIAKLFGTKNNIQCPLCKNKLTKRGLQESTQFKQLAEEIVKTIHRVELDSVASDGQKTTSAEIGSDSLLWFNDDCAQINSSPEQVAARGFSDYRTSKARADSLTKFVRRRSTRNKSPKTEGAFADIERVASDGQKTTSAEIGSDSLLWFDDDCAQINSSPEQVAARGFSDYRTSKARADSLTKFVRRRSTRNKSPKTEGAFADIERVASDGQKTASAEIGSDSLLWFDDDCAQINSSQEQVAARGFSDYRTLKARADSLTKFVRRRSTRNKSPKTEGAFADIERDDTEVSEDTAKSDADDYSCATESEAGLKQVAGSNSESSFCSRDALREMLESAVDKDNKKFMPRTAKMLNTENCPEGKEVFTDNWVPLSLENNIMKKDLEQLDSQEDVNQKDSSSVVSNKTESEKDGFNNSLALKVSRRKSHGAIRKVTDWLSKINVDEVARLGVESNPINKTSESGYLVESGSFAFSEEASSSDDTEEIESEPVASKLKDHRNVTRALVTNVEDKVFGKVYKRNKRRSAPVNWTFRSEIKSDKAVSHREPDFKFTCGKTQKRKTKSTGDFIKMPVNDVWNANTQIDREQAVVPQNIGTKTNEEMMEGPPDSKGKDKPIAATLEKPAVCTEIMKAGHFVKGFMQNLRRLDLKVSKSNTANKKNVNRVLARKRKMPSAKHTAKRKIPLQFVYRPRTEISRSNSKDLNKNKIDSFASSVKRVKPKLKMRTPRRSNGLKFLDEKLFMKGKNTDKKSELATVKSQISTGVVIAPSEQSLENTDKDMECVETKILTMQNNIAQDCNKQLSNVKCSNEKLADFCGKGVVDKLLVLSGDEKQLMYDKAVESGNAALLAKHSLSTGHSHVTIASDTHLKDSSSEASVLLLAPKHVPAREHDRQDMHSVCTEIGKLSSGDTTFLSGSHSRVEAMSSEENGEIAKEQTGLKEATGDTEVNTGQLLNSFKLARRNPFILSASSQQSNEGGCRAVSQSEPLDKSEEDKGAAVSRKEDRNFIAEQTAGTVNLGKTNSVFKEALDANKAKAKRTSPELDNDLQQMSETDSGIVPPTASSSFSTVLSDHSQQMVSLSSWTQGKGLFRQKGSKSHTWASRLKAFDSDRLNQNAEHLNSNTSNNSCLKATNPGKDRIINQNVQQTVLNSELESNAQSEIELIPAGDQLEETEKHNYRGSNSDKLLRKRKGCENNELPQKVPKVVENELFKLADRTSHYSPFVFPDKSVATGKKISENLQISATPKKLFDFARASFHKNITESAVNELSKMQNECEMREDSAQLKPDEEIAEELNSSWESYSGHHMRGWRRRPVKLSTSVSETSDEHLPHLQMFGFNKLHSKTQLVSQSPLKVIGQSLTGFQVKNSSLPNHNTEITRAVFTEANNLDESKGSSCQQNEPLSPNQESEGSPDLFSSHSDDSSPSPSQQLKVCRKVHYKRKKALSLSASEIREKKNEETGKGTPASHLRPQLLEAENMSDYGSDVSHASDSFSSECELLTTQEKNAMWENIMKLEREMAFIEAELNQYSSQGAEHLHSMNHQEDCPESLQPEEKTNSLLIKKDNAEILQTKSKCLPVTEALRPQQQLNTSITFTHGDEEKANCPEPLMDMENGQIPEGLEEMNTLPFKPSSQREMKEPSIAEREKEIKDQADLESEENVVSDETLDNKGKEKGSLVPAETTPGWSPQMVLQHAQGIACSLSLQQSENQRTNEKAVCRAFKQISSSPMPSPVFNKALNPARSTVTAVQRKMSFVASGLNKLETQLVEAFARKMGAEFQRNFSPSTTHVIMKTDADFVCERTLKYFMGIAGRRWVVSYQWVVECFKEGSMIDELVFEVQGDVINGRNHNGPRKARKTVDGKLLLNNYEICCYGSFTGMSRDQLEWMIELCGASIIKEPCLFSYSPNCTEVVVVQPDANPIDRDYKAIERQYNSIVVSREWILDSVACYEHHQLKDYRICLLD